MTFPVLTMGHLWRSVSALPSAIVGTALISAQIRALAATTVLTSPDPAALATAVEQGGTVALAFDGVVNLTETLLVTRDTMLDANGHNVTLDGGKAYRHIKVIEGAALHLINLTLAKGYSKGETGETNKNGGSSAGGSICAIDGTLDLRSCRFLDNQSVGGRGGPSAVAPNGFEAPPTTGGPAFGGALYAERSFISVTNCVFVNNHCAGGEGVPGQRRTGGGGDGFGGAIYVTNSSIRVSGAIFSNNIANGTPMSAGNVLLGAGGGSAYGGAVAESVTTALFQGCIFVTNLVSAAGGIDANALFPGQAFGGGLYHQSGTLTIENTQLFCNRVRGDFGLAYQFTHPVSGPGRGGGLYIESGEAQIRNSALISNIAEGGPDQSLAYGVFFQSGRGGEGEGGGIFNRGNLGAVNCTLGANVAAGGSGHGLASKGGEGKGGAIFNAGGYVSLTNATLAANAAIGGGSDSAEGVGTGVGDSIFAAGGSTTLVNSIVTGSQIAVSGPISDGGHNICSDASANFNSPTSRNRLDPVLGPLAYNGGPTPTMLLLPSSPAIDAGTAAACPLTDQRGVSRPQGLACDIGAFELAPRISLIKDDRGRARVEYFFQADRTNHVTVSTNLVDWTSLSTKLADSEGRFEIEQIETAEWPERFYRVQIQDAQ